MTSLVPANDKPAPMVAGARMAPIIPQSMDEAYRLGKAVCLAGLAPRGMETPEKCMIAIMHGLEIGLPPMTALQRIAVVQGRPTLWGDGAVALVRSSGRCLWIRETIEGEGDAMTAVCATLRKGEPEPVVRTFSVADAKKANLWSKPGPWQQFPKRMLAMRARAFALRDAYADALGGMYLKEEMDNDGVLPTHDGAPVIDHRADETLTESRVSVTSAGEWELLVVAFEEACRIAESASDIIDAENAFRDEAPGGKMPPGLKDRLVTAKSGALTRLGSTAEAAE